MVGKKSNKKENSQKEKKPNEDKKSNEPVSSDSGSNEKNQGIKFKTGNGLTFILPSPEDKNQGKGKNNNPMVIDEEHNPTIYDTLYEGIRQRKPVELTYNNKTRTVYPTVLGNKSLKPKKGIIKRHKNVLCLEQTSINNRFLLRFIPSMIKRTFGWKGFTVNKITSAKLLSESSWLNENEFPPRSEKDASQNLIDDVDVSLRTIFTNSDDESENNSSDNDSQSDSDEYSGYTGDYSSDFDNENDDNTEVLCI